MLTPSYLLHAVEPADEIAEKLHQDLVNRIVERILLRVQRGDNYILTAADKWQIETMQEAGFLLEDIQKEIAKATGYMEEEIKQAMEDAGVRALEYDDGIYKAAGLDPVPLVQSPHMIQLMQRDFEATLGEWKNFTMTTANACQQAFIRACDNAYHLAMTGALSLSQTVKEAIAEAIEDGVYVQYPTGHRDTVETATARAVRTGISQASAHIQLARMEEMDVDLVIVSSHLGARPSHYVWQGKVYSRSGASDKYPDFVSSTGYGSVTGLCGANCRHNFSPWFEGMENPFDQYDSEENQKQYELEQRQRTLERRIRNTKRETMNWKNAADSATDPALKSQFTAEYERKAALLQKQNKAYNDFCESTGQKKRSERIAVAKWDRSQAAQARAAARRYNTPKETLQMFKLNSAYRLEGGSFDLETAKKDYTSFLTSVPEKNRMLLQQSFEGVEYENAKLKSASFGYSPGKDKVLYDTTRSDFWDIDFTAANTHELAHRIDSFFARSVDSMDFSTAIANARGIIEANPQKFIDYCRVNDEQGFLSDIFSAISDGKYRFFAGHDAEYWAEAGNKEREIFANLFSLEAFRDAEKLQFFRANFAELLKAFERLEY